MSKLQTSLIPPATVVAVAAFGITLFFSNLSFFSFLELKGLDLLFVLRGPLSPPNSIVIVAIDEASMAEIGRQWPWPRSLHAQLIQQLNKAGAKVIGFDILFSEPSEPAEDAELARILRGSGNVVLVSALSVVNDPLFRHTIRIDPIPALREAAAVGSPLINIDADGVVRRTRLLAPDLPSFALQVVRRYLKNPTLETVTAAGASRLNQKELSQEKLIDYRGPPKTIKTVSYYQALHYERMLPPGVFAGKIVVVGRLLEAIPEPQRLSGDTFLTPFSWIAGSPSAGVEIQANVIDNILEGRFISELGGHGPWILLLSSTLAASLLVARLKPVTALIATGVLAVLAMTTAYLVFTQMDLWIPILSTFMSLTLVYGGHLLVRALMAEHERRRLLEEINRDLEARIAERTQELSTANRELHQRHREIEATYQELARTHEQLVHSGKMASLGLLVAGVAHELNNPISYVSSNLEFIEDYAERLVKMIETHEGASRSTGSVHRHDDESESTTQFNDTLKTLRELVASCKEGTERVKKIVLDLRIFSRTDDVGLVLADLHEGIESTLNLLAKQYQDRITIHREYGYLPLVECYPGQINQVFMNLLQNAAQAIQNPKGEVWIRTGLDQDRARITIKDNGVGIPEKDMSRIFDPFFTTKPVGSGTGLGLSISYGIIEKHGGKMHVASQVGEGTEFTLELPVRSMRETV